MIQGVLMKFNGFVLMMVLPIVAGLAFYEYSRITFLNMAPAYPFGTWLLDYGTQFLNYRQLILTVGFIALAGSLLLFVRFLAGMFLRILLIITITVMIYFIAVSMP